MNVNAYILLNEAADRLWQAAYALDKHRGDTIASEWAALRVRTLWTSGRATELPEVVRIGEVLESQLHAARCGA